ncbi:unnamed protein product, partial [Durusdinium trenchii]
MEEKCDVSPDAKKEESDQESVDKLKENPEDSDIRELRYKLDAYRAKVDTLFGVRKLLETGQFQESVYGQRDGVLSGLLVCSKEKANIFRQSRAFKAGVIHDICMLPRSAMYKPDCVAPSRAGLPHMGRAMTDIQERRQ